MDRELIVDCTRPIACPAIDDKSGSEEVIDDRLGRSTSSLSGVSLSLDPLEEDEWLSASFE